ncbi:hypothetical protein AB0M77_09185, partial [Streptomyces sp. NPDC051657]
MVQVGVEGPGLELHGEPALFVGDRGAGPQDAAPPDVPVPLQPDRGAAGLERGPGPGRERSLADLQLHPLANTGVDPLDNAVGTQVADFKPLTT